MKKAITLFLILQFTVNCFCQRFDHFVIKTAPLETLIARNPNLFFEKRIEKKTSCFISSGLYNRYWTSNGSEWNMAFYNSKGFRIQSGIRRYFGIRNCFPNAWFISADYHYKRINLNNFILKELLGEYIATANILEQKNEFNVNLGRQFFFAKSGIFHKITFEIYLGIGIYHLDKKTYYIDHFIPSEIGQTDFFDFSYNKFNLFFNVGYYFDKN